jgi:TRAP-type C4-dicarboxylate transport system permease small subunit
MALLARTYHGLLAVLGALSGALIAFLALGITVNVLSRKFGSGEITGALEIFEYSLFAATFLGAPWVLRHNAHVRVDVVVTALPKRLARWVEIGADVLGLAVCLILLFFAWRVTFGLWEEGAREIKEFIFPKWWLFAVIVVSFLLLSVEFGLRLLRVALGGDPTAAGAMALGEEEIEAAAQTVTASAPGPREPAGRS